MTQSREREKADLEGKAGLGRGSEKTGTMRKRNF